MQRQLAKWGLSIADAAAAGWKEVAKIEEQGLPPVHAIKMPYWDPLEPGEPLYAVDGREFCRYRVLPHPLAQGGQLQEGMPRYLQPPGTGVEVYFPPRLDWQRINDNTEIPIILTEGEAKAYRAAKEWFPAIGLGGVNSFRDLKNGYTLCRSLKNFNWRGRTVYIVFDSDICENPSVVAAANQLALSLVDVSAIPRIAFIPPPEDGKAGLDDFLNSHGAEMVENVLSKSYPVSSVESLIRLNRNYFVVKEVAGVYDLSNRKIMSAGNFTAVTEAAEKCVCYRVRVSKKTGEQVVPEIVSAAKEWLKWPMRNEVRSLVYEPGKELLVKESLNVWSGWGCSPRRGEVRIFERLLNHFFGEREADKNWFLQWLAYPLQHPGTKLYTAAVLYSTEHGTGKSFLGQIIGRIYGKNFTEIKNTDFAANFNTWSKNRQFVLGDEITSSDRRAESDTLKRLITSSEIRINEKYVEEYSIRDCVNYLFTTNHPDAFFLEDSDRRFFIHEITSPKLSDEFFAELHNWINEENGHECVFDYLLNYDLTGFNPRARAKDTLAKTLMFESGLGDLASWVRELLRDPENRLVWQGQKLTKDVYGASELHAIYDPSGQTRVTRGGVARELAKAGVRPLLGAKAIQTPYDREKVYAVRNRAAWEQAHVDLVRQHCMIEKLGLGGKF